MKITEATYQTLLLPVEKFLRIPFIVDISIDLAKLMRWT